MNVWGRAGTHSQMLAKATLRLPSSLPTPAPASSTHDPGQEPPSAGRLHRRPTRSPCRAPSPAATVPTVPAGPGPRFTGPVRAAGWAGRNQNILHAIPYLSCNCVPLTGVRRCTAQPADPRARGTGPGRAFICENALHKNHIYPQL